MSDKILLRKRSVIETINYQQENIFQAEHSKLRSFSNFFSNLVTSLIAYSFQEKKPSMKFEHVNTIQLALFVWLLTSIMLKIKANSMAIDIVRVDKQGAVFDD